jgi:hypothetical protein
MAKDSKFALLRKILRALGLSEAAADDIIRWVEDLLSDQKKDALTDYPYHLRDDFLSPAELKFYLVLRQAINDRALIFTKVSLSDLFYVKQNDYGVYRSYTNKIDRKHVDFLLCDPKTVQPLAGIELDDKSHRRQDRMERDEFVDKVFAAADLPLVRFPVRKSYSVSDLRDRIFNKGGIPKEGSDMTSESIVHQEESTPAPRCPKCQSDMVIRVAKSGRHKGSHFWGCSNYPKCRGIVTIEEPVNSQTATR